MIRILLVADSGDVLSEVTDVLRRLEQVDIVAYANGRTRVDAIARAVAPDVALVDEMCWTGLATARIGEILQAQPSAVVLGLVGRPDAGFILEGLRAGASAVVPRDLQPETLRLVLGEALADRARQPLNHDDERHAA